MTQNVDTLHSFFRFCLLAMIGLIGVGCPSRQAAQVNVTTTPPGAMVFFNGEEVGTSPVTVSHLDPGTHTFTAVKAGFREARRSVSLLQGQQTSLDMSMEPVQGLLQIVTNPEGARVFLDGAYRGQAPLFLNDVPAGEHRFSFEAPGYLSKHVDVRISDRTPRRVRADLIPDAGSLQVRSTPSGATVLLNGVERGETPLTIADAPSGENRIEIRMPGYQPFRDQFSLRAQEVREISATLAPSPTQIQIVSIPSGARVYVGNQYRGETPVTLTDLSAGEHRIRAELRGYEPSARTIRLAEETRAVEEFRLVRNSGTLLLTTEPAGARVFIDGEQVGRTEPLEDSYRQSEPLEIDWLRPGEYRLQLSRSGYLHSPRTIRIELNEVTEIHEEMDRRFVVDTRVRLGEVIREGMLLREFANGDIELQLETGTIMRIQADDITRLESLHNRE